LAIDKLPRLLLLSVAPTTGWVLKWKRLLAQLLVHVVAMHIVLSHHTEVDRILFVNVHCMLSSWMTRVMRTKALQITHGQTPLLLQLYSQVSLPFDGRWWPIHACLRQCAVSRVPTLGVLPCSSRRVHQHQQRFSTRFTHDG
jgi:hypothetical protein